jgi:putative salt-induced outer membrane protein
VRSRVSPRTLTLLILLWSLVAVRSAAAQDGAPPPLVSGKAELSLVSATGNSDTQTVGAGGELELRPDTWDVLVRANGVHSSSADTVRAESFTALGRIAHKLADGFDVFGQSAFLRNRFAGIAGRVAVEGGLTYNLLPAQEAHTLVLLAGLGLLRERHVATPTSDFATGSTGARYRWQLTEHSEVADELNVTWNLGDARDWRSAQRASLTAALTEGLSLKLSQQLDFKRQPEPGFRRTDTLTSAALVVTF